MTDSESGKVQEYRREKLEPEIVAMSIQVDEEENPVLIVNIDSPAAKGAIKKVIGWLGVLTGIGWLIKWAQRSARRQIALAVASTAAVATTAAVVVVEAAQDSEARPPVTAQRVVTVPASPPVTVTVTPPPDPTATPPPTRDVPPSERSRPRLIDVADRPNPPRASAAPTPATESTRPRRRRPTTPTGPATAPPPARTEAPPAQADAAEDEPPRRDVDSPESTSAPTIPDDTPEESTAGPEPPPPPPPAEPEPTLAAADCDGLVEVDLDPLLDLCVLG